MRREEGEGQGKSGPRTLNHRIRSRSIQHSRVIDDAVRHPQFEVIPLLSQTI